MATRRMISKELLESDEFVKLSQTAKLLYIYLTIYADDDGIIGNPQYILNISNSSNNDLLQLVEDGLVIYYTNNRIIVIRDWLRWNRIQPSRYKPTKYTTIRESLVINEASQYQSVVCRQDNDNKSNIDIVEYKKDIDKYRLEVFPPQKNKKITPIKEEDYICN